MPLFRGSLVRKLIGINVALLLGLIVAIWMTIHYRAADYFTELMRAYQISPATLHEMFLDAVRRYLAWVSLLGIGLAVTLNFFLLKRILKPLMQIASMTESIAMGHFSGRVRSDSRDEVGEVARAFNRMAASLERIEHLRRTMVADVAHELRTPLTNILGYLEGLRDGVVSPSREAFASLHEETVRLANVVENLLELTKADAAKTNLRPEPLSIAQWLPGVVALYRNRFEARQIKVRLEIDENVGTVEADPNKLVQVVRNLLENAWRYTDAGGWLEVRAIRRTSSVEVGFTNSGPGIAAGDVPLVFERFYRGEKSRSRELGGAGIGLAIVRELVEAHGGTVGVESPSGRTRVWFILPDRSRPPLPKL